jgi:hypothetical protein
VITWERLVLNDNLVPSLDIRLVERRHEQVQISREGLHDGDFVDLSAHNGSNHLGGTVIDIEPSWQGRVAEGLEMALNALCAPSG